MYGDVILHQNLLNIDTNASLFNFKKSTGPSLRKWENGCMKIIKYKTYLNHRQQKVLAYYALYSRKAQTSDKVCRISWPPERVTSPLWEQKISPRPSFPVSMISGDLFHGSAGCALDSGWCSSTSATLTVTGTGNCLLEKRE